MICNQAKERMLAFVEGQVPHSEAAEIEEHLAECDGCRKEADLLRENVDFLRSRLARLQDAVHPDLSFLAAAPAPAPAKPEPAPAAPREKRPFRIPIAVPVTGLVLLLGAAAWFGLRGGGDDGAREEADATARRPEAPVAPDASSRPSTPVRNDSGPAPARPPRNPTRPTPESPPPVVVRSQVVQLLPALLQSPSDRALTLVWRALEEDPSQAKLVLGALDRAPDERSRALVTLALAGAANDPVVRERLLGILQGDSSPGVRVAAAAALGRSAGNPSGVVPAVGGLGVPVGPVRDADLRASLLAAAEAERDPAALGKLVRILGPSQSEDATITRRFVELARGGDESIRDEAIEAIRIGRPRDPAPVAELVFDSSLPEEARAKLVPAVVLAAPEQDAVARARDVVSRAPEPAVKAAAVRALAERPPEETFAFAAELLGSAADAGVRTEALARVAESRTEAALRAIEAVADSDSDPGLREAARAAADRLKKEIGDGK